MLEKLIEEKTGFTDIKLIKTAKEAEAKTAIEAIAEFLPDYLKAEATRTVIIENNHSGWTSETYLPNGPEFVIQTDNNVSIEDFLMAVLGQHVDRMGGTCGIKSPKEEYWVSLEGGCRPDEYKYTIDKQPPYGRERCGKKVQERDTCVCFGDREDTPHLLEFTFIYPGIKESKSDWAS